MPLPDHDTAESSERIRGAPSFFLGAGIGAFVVALAWILVVALTSGDSSSDRDDAGRAALSSTTPRSVGLPEYGAETQTYLARCREVFQAQSAPLKAAAVAMDQWEVHIGAMNKLVVGAITLKQATQFWNQTRVGASENLKSFASARELYQQRSSRCPEPNSSLAKAISPERRACYRAVAARHDALRLGLVSLETWKGHVHHMEMLRRGEMTPQEATQLWLQSWHQGNDELRAYRAAARAAKGKIC